jgi:hypothetical protein
MLDPVHARAQAQDIAGALVVSFIVGHERSTRRGRPHVRAAFTSSARVHASLSTSKKIPDVPERIRAAGFTELRDMSRDHNVMI